MVIFIFAWLCFGFGSCSGFGVPDVTSVCDVSHLVNDYTVYSCTKTGVFSFSRNVKARVLVVGSGGYGGSRVEACGEGGGGGGGGQFLEVLSVQFNAGVQNNVVIGPGGGSITSVTAIKFANLFYSAIGGGNGANANNDAGIGASGGGGNGCNYNRPGGQSFGGLGYSGGTGINRGPGGGGGGAGGAGGSDGSGGIGKQWSVNSLYYAAGGGGGYSSFSGKYGQGGSNIGGTGGSAACVSGSDAAPNTGSGGGGGAGDCQSSGGRGSSGVVLIAFIECKAGYALALPTDESCSQCPAGKSSLYGDNSCTTCLAGKYSSSGSAQCSNCVAGKYSSDGSAKCSDCQPGQFSYQISSSCQACPKNTYAPSTGGPQACKPCPDGTNSTTGSVVCISCPDGYYSISGYDCQWCGAMDNPLLAVDKKYRWVGGPTKQQCHCVPGYSRSSNCATNECGTNVDIPGMSLGSLLMNSDIQLRTYSATIGTFAGKPTTQDQFDRLNAAYGYLYNLLAIDVDVNGDSNITRSEMTDALRFREVSIANSDSIPVWCKIATTGNCLNKDVVQVKDIYSDALNNFKDSLKHTFDGSGVDVLSQFTATYPSSSWSKDTCQLFDQSLPPYKPLSVNWTLSQPQSTSILLVCAYDMSTGSPIFSKDQFTYPAQESFTDLSPISTISSFKRMYCVRVVTDQSESVECIPGLTYVSYSHSVRIVFYCRAVIFSFYYSVAGWHPTRPAAQLDFGRRGVSILRHFFI